MNWFDWTMLGTSISSSFIGIDMARRLSRASRLIKGQTAVINRQRQTNEYLERFISAYRQVQTQHTGDIGESDRAILGGTEPHNG